MRVLLTFALIALTTTLQTQTSMLTSSDLVVLKFGWSKYVSGSGLIHPVEADPAPGPMVINRTPRKETDSRPAAAPLERHAELAALEQNAALSTDRRTNVYVYRIQVKNEGTKPIKSFVWASEDPADGENTPGRQFLCTVKTKPSETKALAILSTLAPSPVVDASKAGDKTQKSPALSAVINRIEYGDGSIWQRAGWDPSILSRDPRQKVDGGKCVRL